MSVGSKDRVCFERENKPPKEADRRGYKPLGILAPNTPIQKQEENSAQRPKTAEKQRRPQSVLTAATMVTKFILDIRGLLLLEKQRDIRLYPLATTHLLCCQALSTAVLLRDIPTTQRSTRYGAAVLVDVVLRLCGLVDWRMLIVVCPPFDLTQRRFLFGFFLFPFCLIPDNAACHCCPSMMMIR